MPTSCSPAHTSNNRRPCTRGGHHEDAKWESLRDTADPDDPRRTPGRIDADYVPTSKNRRVTGAITPRDDPNILSRASRRRV